MSAMAFYRARDVGPTPALGLGFARVLSRVFPRLLLWSFFFFCLLLGVVFSGVCSGVFSLFSPLSWPRRAKRGAGLVSFINNVQRGG